MDDMVLATRDLIALGFDREMALSICSEAMDRRMAELAAAWPQGKNLIRRDAEFNRAALQYDFSVNCPRENEGDRWRLDRQVPKLWTGLNHTG